MDAPLLGCRLARLGCDDAMPVLVRECPANGSDGPRSSAPVVLIWSASKMNTFPGVVGRKLGMTQLIAEDGTVTAVTVIEANAVVVGKRTKDKDGYDALILGIDAVKEKHQSKAVRGSFKSKNLEPKRVQREFRCDAEY